MKMNPRIAAAGLRTALRRTRMEGAPIQLQIEPTNFCNYDCLMCIHKSAIPIPCHLDFGLFEKIVTTIRPSHVTLNGYGETLLNPRLFDMVRLLKSQGAYVNTTTNGFILDRFAHEAIDSGLDQISISIDAATDASYAIIRRKDSFEKVLDNVRLLVEARREKAAKIPLIRGTFVIQNTNISEIEPFVRLAGKLGLDGVYFQPFINFEKDIDRPDITSQILRDTLITELQKALETSRSIGIASNIVPFLKKLDDYISVQYQEKMNPSIVRQCAKPFFSAYISAEGHVRPCCSFAAIPLNMGNIADKGIMEIMNSDAMVAFREGLRSGRPPHWLCSRCVPISLHDVVFQLS